MMLLNIGMMLGIAAAYLSGNTVVLAGFFALSAGMLIATYRRRQVA